MAWPLTFEGRISWSPILNHGSIKFLRILNILDKICNLAKSLAI